MNIRLVLALAALVLTACEETPQPRHYTEIAFRSKTMPGMPATAEAPIQITWSLPDGWVEEPGGDPMRVASFRAPDPSVANTGDMDPQAVDVSIVQFAGEGGGLPANIQRWLGQIKIIATPDQIQNVIAHAPAIKAATGQKGIFVDLTDMISGDMTQSASILGAIYQGNGYIVFIKAKGDRERLLKLKKQVRGFCETVSIAEEKK
jgi:hypothetical protein